MRTAKELVVVSLVIPALIAGYRMRNASRPGAHLCDQPALLQEYEKVRDVLLNAPLGRVGKSGLKQCDQVAKASRGREDSPESRRHLIELADFVRSRGKEEKDPVDFACFDALTAPVAWLRLSTARRHGSRRRELTGGTKRRDHQPGGRAYIFEPQSITIRPSGDG